MAERVLLAVAIGQVKVHGAGSTIRQRRHAPDRERHQQIVALRSANQHGAAGGDAGPRRQTFTKLAGAVRGRFSHRYATSRNTRLLPGSGCTVAGLAGSPPVAVSVLGMARGSAW